jgi:hypothetical protein
VAAGNIVTRLTWGPSFGGLELPLRLGHRKPRAGPSRPGSSRRLSA